MKKIFLIFCLLCASVWTAAQTTMTASVDKDALTLDDELTLTVRITGVSGNLVMPQLPSLPAFNVYSREVQQNSVNGDTTLEFRYVMLPRFVGQTSIGAVTFNYNGKTYKTAPISVRIYRTAQNLPAAKTASKKLPAQQADPNLPPLERNLANQAYLRANEKFFLVAAVSDYKPYVNEPFTLAVRFYYSQSFYDAPYQKPAVTNIFMEDAGSSEGTQAIGGVMYRYTEQRYRLTAAAPGPASIGAATVKYQTGSSPFSAFDRLFGGAAVSEEHTASSSPITVTVRALPAGKPASFYGAVGENYTISAQADPTHVEAGEAVNVTVTVQGPGGLKSTSDMTFPAMDGFKIYPAAPETGNLPSPNNAPRGYKTFKAVLVPSASGIYTVPSVKWSYFNPRTGAYKTIQTAPIQLTVSPATKTASGFNFAASAPAATGIQTLGSDVRYLKTEYAPEPGVLDKLAGMQHLHWAFLALLAAGALFALVGQKSLAQKRAYTAARARLKKAFSEEEVADAVADYLQQKFNISTGSLPLKTIVETLRTKGVKPSAAEAFSLLWQRLDAARFAPGEPGAQSVLDLSAQARDVLKLLEERNK